MAHLTADRVRETTTTTGTGAITLAGAVVGFRAFSSVLSIGDTCYYSVASLPGTEWEVGVGTYSALNTLTRTTVLSSSNAGAAVTFSAGTKEIFITAAASRFLQADNTNNYTVTSTTASTSTTTGALIVSGGLGVSGALNATTKSFVIDHPTKEGKLLRHGSLEGPEFGVYVRGRTTSGLIELPEYWRKLIDPDTITVNLTPIGAYKKLYVESFDSELVVVKNAGLFSNDVNCFYTIFAERIDVEKLQLEVDA